MRYLFVIPIAVGLAGCSHAEMSATTPAPHAAYVVASTIEGECIGRARGGESFFVERMGL
jgi:hypothetical protein